MNKYTATHVADIQLNCTSHFLCRDRSCIISYAKNNRIGCKMDKTAPIRTYFQGMHD